MYNFFATTNNEQYEFTVIPRINNSDYQYDNSHKFTFKGRPANTQETKNYRIQKGVNGNVDTVYIFATNLPNEVKPGDKVKFLGHTQIVESVGYYYDMTGIINPGIYNEDYIIARCPKGIALGS